MWTEGVLLVLTHCHMFKVIEPTKQTQEASPLLSRLDPGACLAVDEAECCCAQEIVQTQVEHSHPNVKPAEVSMPCWHDLGDDIANMSDMKNRDV